ncbi:DNA gyrase inhibitor YacG [Azospirillum sp. YIM B02556]|uniref:DNA gyrase inhibitor YacG n=1 Tax=Azospirillum endophyticum TaxID=2800326 RepID=A0ABS1F3V2_9PROT|nr:DNA gyrase inhibitor YacG [Azospirillum endophyticum]MBK1838105.1 DNA gyrase inhibitor YacG [Azospirillum endophyticum]
MSDPQSPGAPQRPQTHAAAHAGAKAASDCPICGRPTEPATRPFCSKRCADIDLSRWLGGVYRIEGPESPGNPGGSDPDDGL